MIPLLQIFSKQYLQDFGFVGFKTELMVVEWYKDEQTKALVRNTISAELDKDLPDSYDKESFNSKTNLLLNHFMDMSVQGYGWVA